MKRIVASRFLLPLTLPVIGGFLGIGLEEIYWLWLLPAIALPVISFLAACRPSKTNELKPVESEDIFKELKGIN